MKHFNPLILNTQKTFVLMLMFFCLLTHAQNKVPNPGFETYSQLPNGYSQLSRATGWTNPLGNTAGSPDYLNTAGTFHIADKIPPRNPSETGYAGAYLEYRNVPTPPPVNPTIDFKEYMTVQLVGGALVAGATYTLSFYTAHLYGNPPAAFNMPSGLTFHDLPETEKGYMGAVFSTAPPVAANTVGNTSPRWTSIKDDFGVGRTLIPNINTQVYGEPSRNQWVRVILQYTAVGTETYMTVGQFRPGATNLGNIQGAYYVYDDFFLTVPVVLTKSVSPSSIITGGTATYTFTLNNTALGNTVQNGMSFTDNLPTGLRIASTPNVVVTGLTDGTVTAAAGAASIAVSGYSQAANTTATITVNVTNVPGQTNGSCGSNPAAFTNTAANIVSMSQNITNSIGNVCLIVTCPAGSTGPVIN